MSQRLDGYWLAFFVPQGREGQAITEGLIHAIQRFNERFGSLPRILGANPQSPLYSSLADAARRLGLEPVADEHIPPRDFWLGPVERVPEAA